MSTRLRHCFASSTIAASALVGLSNLGGLAWAAPTALASPDLSGIISAGRSTLKPLPAGAEDLLFQSEGASRRWSVALTRDEATRITALQLGVLSAISVLPDRSTIKVTVNGRVLTTAPLGTASKTTDLSVRVPSGTLVPGFNAVQIDVAQTHRVDCSVDATYELWTRLEPSRTGFLVPATAVNTVRGIDELAAEPLALDGTTRIHLRLSAQPDASELTRAGRLLSALVVKARLAHPVVDVGSEAGTGPGLDVVVATGSSLDGLELGQTKIIIRDQDLVLARDVLSGRLTLIVSGTDEDDLDSAVNRYVEAPAPPPLGTTQGIEALLHPAGVRFDAAAEVPLSSLGWQGSAFSGRRYESSVRIDMPGDFYPGNYGTARLFLDGSRSEAIDKGNPLTVWVNGKLVSSLDLSREPEHLDHEQVDLPLRFFRPGGNDIDIKAITTTAADKQCDVGTAPATPRLTLAATSELQIPEVAHLETLMRLQRSLRFAIDGSVTMPVDAYLPDMDRYSLGAALTLATNLARNTERAGTVRFHLQAPTPEDVPGLVIASTDAVPPFLRSRLPSVASTGKEADNVAPPSSDVLEAAAAANSEALQTATHRWVATGLGWLRERGFFFASDRDTSVFRPITGPAVLMATVDPAAKVTSLAGVALPRFSSDGRQWLVVAADQTDLVEAGMTRLTQDGRWPNLSGQAVSLDIKTGSLQSVDDTQPTYVVPRHMALSDVRPVLGGFVSNNIALSAVILLTLLSLFGLSTHAVVRRAGVKPR